MSEVLDTQDPLDLESGIESTVQPTESAPKRTRGKGKVDPKKETNLLTRIETAKVNIQASKVNEAKAIADVFSNDVIDLADKFTALNIVEQSASSIQRAGTMATNFLRSTPTGMDLEDALICTIDTEDPFLMLMGI